MADGAPARRPTARGCQSLCTLGRAPSARRPRSGRSPHISPRISPHLAARSLEAEDEFSSPNHRSRGHALNRIRPQSAVFTVFFASLASTRCSEDSAQCRLPVPMLVYESFEVLRPYAGLFTPRRLDGAAAARVLVGGAEGPRGGNTHSCLPASAREDASRAARPHSSVFAVIAPLILCTRLPPRPGLGVFSTS